jgi:protein-S-isoprenylcysteine O-methyltransferase Ste14
MEKENHKSLRFRMILRTVLGLAVVLGVSLLAAGTWNYWQAWVFAIVNLLLILLNGWALRKNPDLIEERLKPGQGMAGWDKTYFYLSTPLYFLMLIIAGLDVGRFGWTGPLPVWVYILGYLLYLSGQLIFLWAKSTNLFFSSVVRIQSDRGHQVCKDGPYRYVRHPGYVGGMLYMVSGGLVLGSIWAILPQMIAALLLVYRTRMEDQFLRNELPGYAEYSQEVRFRLVPKIW